MATIFPPFRSLAARAPLRWSDNNAPLGGAVIDGFAANFGGIAGGEQVTLRQGGGPATLITMVAGDITAALVAARINASLPAFAAVGPSGGVRLTDPVSAEVTIISGAHQAFIGLPAFLLRDAAAGFVAQGRPELGIETDRVDLVSEAVVVPDGANRVAVWVRVLGQDSTGVGSRLFFGFSNGVDGEVTTSVFDMASVGDLEPYAVDLSGIARDYLARITGYYAPTPAPNQGFFFTGEVDVPPGATKFFVLLAGATNPATGLRAYSPGIITGGVIPGVR